MFQHDSNKKRKIIHKSSVDFGALDKLLQVDKPTWACWLWSRAPI